MDNNEQDSGVGSDSINPLEKEDQNVDDMPVDSISISDQTELNQENEEPEEPENAEDSEETEALEATCRETIENLRKLGEDSR